MSKLSPKKREAMPINVLKPLTTAIALLTIGFLNPMAQAATLSGEAEGWSSEEFSIRAETYSLSPEISRLSSQELIATLEDYPIFLNELEPQLGNESEFIQISLAFSTDNGETESYFQDLLDTLSNVNLSIEGSTDEAYVPTLPQVEYSNIFKDVYDYSPQPSSLRQNRLELRQPSINRASEYAQKFRPFEQKRTLSFLHQDPRQIADFFSFELSNFGEPVVSVNLAEQPEVEFLLALNNYSNSLSDIAPMPGEFGALSLAVELPRQPQERLPKRVYRKYFAEDNQVQQELQRQAEAQHKAQQKHLRRLQRQ